MDAVAIWRLRAFVYILMRDHLPAGEIEAVIADHLDKLGRDREADFSSKPLAVYAADLVERICGWPATKPADPGESHP